MATGTFITANGGNWSLASNWSGPIPDGVGDVANLTFDANTSNTSVILIDNTSRTVGVMVMADSVQSWNGTNANYTSFSLNASGGAYLTLDNGASVPTITANNAGAVINAPLYGTNGFTKLGTATLNVRGTNSLLGTITVSAGTLAVGNNGTTGDFGAASNNIVVASGATASLNRSDAYTIDGSITGAGTFSKVTGTGNLTLTYPTISVGTLTHSAGTLILPTVGQTISSSIGGAGAITISAPGTVTFSGGGSNTGAWTLNTGTILNVTTAAHTGTTGNITVVNGSTLTTSVSLLKPVIVQSGGTATLNGAAGIVTVLNGGVATINGNTSSIEVTGLGATIGAGTSSGNISLVFGASGSVNTIVTLPTGRNINAAYFIANSSSNISNVAVYQEGATIYGTDSATPRYSYIGAGTVNDSYTYWNLKSGTLGTNNWLEIGTSSTTYTRASVLEARGTGTLSGQWGIGWNSPGDYAVHFENTSQTTSNYQIGFGSSTNARLYTSIDNVSLTISSGASLQFLQPANANNQTNVAVRGLGGMLSGNTTGTGTGVIALVDGATYSFTGTLPSTVTLLQFGAGNKIDSAGTATLASAITTTASTTGITNINVSNVGGGYIGAPVVRITGGGGIGAVARAEWNKSTGTITSVTVISPGAGYTSAPTITLVGGGYTTQAVATATIGTVPTQTSVEKTGVGTLIITGTNTYAGATTVTGGFLQVGSGSTAGSIDSSSGISLAAGAGFYYGRSDNKTWSIPISSTVTSTIGVASTGSLTFSTGWLSGIGFGGSLFIGSTGGITTDEASDITLNQFNGTGTGTWTKNNLGKVTFTGGGPTTSVWAINAGTVEVTTNPMTATTGLITVGANGTLTSTAAISKPITISAGSTGNNVVLGGSGALTVSGTITTSGTSTRPTTVTATGNLTSNGSIGALTTTIGSRAIINGNTGAVSNGGTGTVLNAGTSGLLTVANIAGDSILRINAGRTSSFSGSASFVNAANAYGALYQTGGAVTYADSSGSVALQPIGTGSYFYYLSTGGTFGNTGTSNIQTIPPTAGIPQVFEFRGGTLSTASSFGQWNYGDTRRGPLAVVFNSGTHVVSGTLALAGNIQGTDTYQALWFVENGATLTAGAAVATATSSSTALSSITISGADSKFIVTGTLTYAGTVTKHINLVNGGTFSPGNISGTVSIRLFGNSNKIGHNAASVIPIPIQNATGNGVASITFSGGGTAYIGAPVVQIAGGGGSGATARAVFDETTGTITGITVVCPGTDYTSAPTVSFSGGGTNAVPPTGVVVTLTPTTTDGSISKVESGTTTLTATNTNTGTYKVTSGTLRIGNAGTTGTLGLNDASNADISSGAVLAFGRSDARTYGGTISGDGTIAVNGGGRVILTGNNSFTSLAAPIALSTTNSILRLSNNNAVGQATSTGITVASTTALELDGSSTPLTSLPAKALNLSGTGVSSTGALRNIAGNNTYPGTLTLGGAATIASDADTLTLSSTSPVTGNTLGLTFTGAGNIVLAAPVNTTTGTVTKTGTGLATLTAYNSTYTGKTTVSGGTLAYVGAAAAGAVSSFGQPAAGANAVVDLAGAATAATCAGIRFVGPTPQTFSRTINITGATAGFVARIESSGTAAVTHSTAFTNTTNNQARTYQLGGTGTAANTVSFLIANNGTGAVSITKSGSGRWVLNNTGNSYTGNTVVEDGTLVFSIASWVTGATVTSTGSVTVKAGAKIQTLTGSGSNPQNGRHSYGNGTFEPNSCIRIGGYAPPGTLYVTGTLTITGATTWSFTDNGFKLPGLYRVIEFGASGGLTGGQATLDTYVTPNVVVPTGRTVTALTYVAATGGVPAHILLELA